MKAILVEEFKKRLQVKEVAEPKIRGPFDALVRIHASGVCHTDLHAADGDWPVKPALPFIPGHEGVGVVEEVGALVTNIRPGDRVGSSNAITPVRGWKISMAFLMKCAPARSTVASCWK